MSNRKRFGVICIAAALGIIGILSLNNHLSRGAWIELWWVGAALALAGNFCIWTAE